MRLKLDENLGRGAVALLRQAGHDVRSVIDEGLQGTPDRSLIETCRSEGRCLVTLDLEFSNPVLFAPADFAGIAVLRPDRLSEEALARTLETLIAGLESEEIAGKLWIVQPGRIRRYEPPDS